MVRRSLPDERGAALLIVVVAVAVLTALAAELAYDARVSLRIAANARDELQATELAKGGVALSRLVLSFQQQLDGMVPSVKGQPTLPRPQIWRVVPIGSGLTAGLLGAPPAPSADRAAAPSDGFEAKIADEGAKVNMNLDDLGISSGPVLGAKVQAIWQLVCDARWDPLFDREDENGLRVSRQDLLVYLRDWVDRFSVSSVLSASIPPGGCGILPTPVPFEDGFGDENFPYDRGDDPYRTKNERMDSLDELYMVAGIGDAFMAAFGDRITVYPPRDDKQTLSLADPNAILFSAARIADPPVQPALYDPLFKTRLVQLVQQETFGFLTMSWARFGQLVEAAGVSVASNLLVEGTSSPFTDTSSTFRVRATGRAGAVTKRLDVVLRFPKTGTAAAQPTTVPGLVVHWREE